MKPVEVNCRSEIVRDSPSSSMKPAEVKIAEAKICRRNSTSADESMKPAGVKIADAENFLLPHYVLEDILNRLGDARDIARAQLVCRDFYEAGKNVRSLRFIVLDEYHERARNAFDMRSLESGISGKSLVSDEGESSSSEDLQRGKPPLKFKELMVKILATKLNIAQFRVEIEPKLQAKTVSDDERKKTDFWISDPFFLRQWIRPLKFSLEHLCIVDYGQQAIMRRSSIIRDLSLSCKRLKTLELRNMYIDTSDCDRMPLMTSLTWRCVKVNGRALQDINEKMPKLQTWALLGVFGAEEGNLNLQDLTVLCLGLSTPAKKVEMDLPKLEKLQLKMQCPQELVIRAYALKYVAFNLAVSENSKVKVMCNSGLQELLYGARRFTTLSSFIEENKNLKRIFLDIPCMALGEDGRFLGVLKDVPLMLPSFSKIHECRDLEVLNIGPGLWYCMESNVDTIVSVQKLPTMSRLILHMIAQNLDPSIRVLQKLLRASVKSLEIHIHTSSPVKAEILTPAIEAVLSGCDQHINHSILTWTKSLDFSCFSF